jgi:hypothetical protein
MIGGHPFLVVNTASGLAGGHEYVINGVSLAPSSGAAYYRMKNSWGRQWPADVMKLATVPGPGTARIVCTELEDLIFNRNGDCVLVTEVA